MECGRLKKRSHAGFGSAECERKVGSKVGRKLRSKVRSEMRSKWGGSVLFLGCEEQQDAYYALSNGED